GRRGRAAAARRPRHSRRDLQPRGAGGRAPVLREDGLQAGGRDPRLLPGGRRSAGVRQGAVMHAASRLRFTIALAMLAGVVAPLACRRGPPPTTPPPRPLLGTISLENLALPPERD